MIGIAQGKIYGLVLLAAVISCFAGFYNNFPLVYQDTGTYIRTAFETIVPPERPVFYGLFIKWTSVFESLWPVILAQGLITCYLIYITLGLFFERQQRNLVFIGSIVFVTLFTGFSYNVSILIPEIFAPIALLSLLNLLVNKKLHWPHMIFISVLLVFSSCTQLASLPITALLLGLLACYGVIKKIRKSAQPIPVKRLVLCFVLFLSCLVLVPTVNYSYDKKFRMSDASHVFAMNHLLQAGILPVYLSEACATHNYKICAYKDELGWDLLWAPDSPTQKTGGWEANRKEYEAIVHDVMTTPRYLGMYIIKAIEFSVMQFFTFEVTLVTPDQLSAPKGQIEWHYNSEIREFICGRQNRGAVDLRAINAIQQIVVMLSLVFLLALLGVRGLRKQLSFELKAALAIILMYIVISSAVCSNLSTVLDRYQNRLVWLFPLMALVVLAQWLDQKTKRNKTEFTKSS